MNKHKVLFVCVHNSARSQMAEAWLKALYGDRFDVKSAGIEPGTLNPLVIRVMAETGIDISGNWTKGIYDLLKAGESFSWVITVCDEAAAERCPLFPGAAQRLHWSFPDPSRLEGSEADKLAALRKIRDDIRTRIEEWAASVASRPAGEPRP
jgi:arsenate reductase (thioredoxin)